MQPDLMLMIPGPTPVPHAILEVLARPPIGHRSPDFKAVLNRVHSGLQWVFQTKQSVFLYTASGTGAMEAALVNVLNPGDEILVLACGVFSQRWANIAKALGLVAHIQEVPAGQPNSLEDLKAFLGGPQAKNIKAVCMIHSETSTGVLNPVKELTETVRQYSDALVIVDTVTSLGAAPFALDAWGVDIAVSGSQKGFMLPPGLAFLAASERALQAHQQVKAPGYYFQFNAYLRGATSDTTPYTPALGLIRGLDKALELMQAEGLEAIYTRHRLNQKMTRSGAVAMGLSLFVSDMTYASTAVTAILPPSDVDVATIRSGLKQSFNITVANGQKELEGKIFRIGHLGAIYPRDVLTALASLEAVCHQSGYHGAPLGSAVAKAQEVWIQHG